MSDPITLKWLLSSAKKAVQHIYFIDVPPGMNTFVLVSNCEHLDEFKEAQQHSFCDRSSLV